MDQLKCCAICCAMKPLSEFPRNRGTADGHHCYCRPCESEYRRDRREVDPESKTEYNARWREKNPGYSSSYMRRYRDEKPEAYAAHKIIRSELRSGRLKPPAECVGCGRAVRLDSHHADYSKPLEVTWLCRRCHRRTHAGVLAERQEGAA